MSTTRGCFGVIKAKAVGAPDLLTVAEIRSWNFDESSEVLDASAMGNCTKKFESGAVQSTGQLQCWWDPADEGQVLFKAGEKVALELFPGGETGPTTKYVGEALITGLSRSASVDGIVEQTMSFQVNGSMVPTAIVAAPLP